MMASSLLQRKGVGFEVLCVDGDPGLRQEMMARSGRSSVPQIFIGEHHVGGCDDLHALDGQGKLDEMLGLAAG
jgi:glutaredoxin 3